MSNYITDVSKKYSDGGAHDEELVSHANAFEIQLTELKKAQLIRIQNDKSNESIDMRRDQDDAFKWTLEDYNKQIKEELEKLKKDETSLHLGDLYNNRANIYYAQGVYNEALKGYKDAKEIYLAMLDDQHFGVGQVYNNIADVYRQQDKYDEALECYNKALMINLNVYGTRHLNVGMIINNKGVVYKEQGDYKKALKFFNKSLEIYLDMSKKPHLDMARTYQNMADVYKQQDKYNLALEFYNKALEIKVHVWEESDSSYAHAMVHLYSDMATSYQQQGDYENAISYFNKAINIHIGIKLFWAGEKRKKLYPKNDEVIAFVKKEQEYGVFFKTEGDRLVKEKKYKEAIEQYTLAIKKSTDLEKPPLTLVKGVVQSGGGGISLFNLTNRN